MTMLLLAGMLLPAGAQKFALVDMEYILKNIPAYERANEQLSQPSTNRHRRFTRTTRTSSSSSPPSRRNSAKKPSWPRKKKPAT